jgi:hypothetical protein
MKKIKIGCWIRHPQNSSNEIVYVTDQDRSFGGHTLVICLNCGEIYAGDDICELYLIPLCQKLNETNCIKCGKSLGETAKPYPQHYLDKNGEMKQTNRISEGRDEDRIIHEFWGLYEKD